MACLNINSLNHTVDDERSQLAISAEYDRRLPVVVMLSLFGLIGIPGNAIVLKVYWREKKLKATQFLIFAIAFFDFNTALVAIPLNLVRNTYWFDIIDIRFCKLVLTLNITLVAPQLYLVFGVSLVRYYHVCKHQAINWLERNLKYFFVCIFLIQMSFSVSMGIAAGCKSWHKNDQDLPGFRCHFDDQYDDYSFVRILLGMSIVMYIFCVGGILGFNFRILKTMITQRKIMLNYKVIKKGKSTSRGEALSKGKVEPHVKGPEEMSKCSDNSYRTVTISSSNSSDRKSHSTKGVVTTDYPDQHTDIDIENQDTAEPTTNSEADRQSFLEHRKKSRRQSPNYNRRNITTSIELKVEGTDSDKKEEAQPVDTSLTERTIAFVWSFFGSISSNSRASRIGNDRGQSNPSFFSKQGINIFQITTSRNGTKKAVENRKKKRPFYVRYVDRFLSSSQIDGLNRTTLKLSIASLVYLISYLPYFTIQFQVTFRGQISRQQNPNLFKYVLFPSSHMPFLTTAVNPLIYTFVDPKFRAQCRSLFTRR